MKSTAKHYLIIGLLLSLLLITWALPYVAGRIQFNNAERVINEFELASDGDIEHTLKTFGFNLAWGESPTFADYYAAGMKIEF